MTEYKSKGYWDGEEDNCDKREDTQELDELTGFLYLLMRDHMVAAKVEEVVNQVLRGRIEVPYSCKYLAMYADSLAQKIYPNKEKRLLDVSSVIDVEDKPEIEKAILDPYHMADEDFSEIKNKVNDAIKTGNISKISLAAGLTDVEKISEEVAKLYLEDKLSDEEAARIIERLEFAEETAKNINIENLAKEEWENIERQTNRRRIITDAMKYKQEHAEEYKNTDYHGNSFSRDGRLLYRAERKAQEKPNSTPGIGENDLAALEEKVIEAYKDPSISKTSITSKSLTINEAKDMVEQMKLDGHLAEDVAKRLQEELQETEEEMNNEKMKKDEEEILLEQEDVIGERAEGRPEMLVDKTETSTDGESFSSGTLTLNNSFSRDGKQALEISKDNEKNRVAKELSGMEKIDALVEQGIDSDEPSRFNFRIPKAEAITPERLEKTLDTLAKNKDIPDCDKPEIEKAIREAYEELREIQESVKDETVMESSKCCGKCKCSEEKTEEKELELPYDGC